MSLFLYLFLFHCLLVFLWAGLYHAVLIIVTSRKVLKSGGLNLPAFMSGSQGVQAGLELAM